MHAHTEFGIPNSKSVGDMLRTLETMSEGKVNTDPKMALDTLSSQDASTHQILDSYLKYCRRYATDTIILDMRSQVKVTVLQIWCVTHCPIHQILDSYLK